MAIHLRPNLDDNPARHTISRHCACKPKVTIQGDQLIVTHQSDVPWSWANVVRKV